MDHDGYISHDDMMQAQESLGITMTEEEVELLIKKGDLDNDEMLSFPEFLALFKNN